MPVFDITAPDGKQYEIEGATAEGALAALQKHLGASSVPAKAPAASPGVPPSMSAPAFGEEPDLASLARQQPVTASMPYGEQMSRLGNALDKGARLVANGATFGLADKFAGGMDAVTGAAPSYDAGVKAQRAQTDAIRTANPSAAAVTEAAGGLLSGAGLLKSGVTLAGRFGTGMLPRVLGYGAEGAGYGAAHGAGNTYSDKVADYIDAAKGGATTGALVGGALPLAGAAAGGLYRTGAAFLGPRVEGAGRGASAMLRSAAMADESGLRNLPAMGSDAMLVDAGPAMLGLGQGAGTGTGAGRTALVDALRSRDAGTGNRLAATLDQNFGRSPVPSQVEAGLAGGREALGPAYAQVLDDAGVAAAHGAPPMDTRALAQNLEALTRVERGPAQQAARQVRQMLNDQHGALDRSPDTLLNTRQAIDGMLATEADPNTIRVLTQTRRAVDAELANVPGLKDVDAQFSELSRQSAGLQRGSQVLDSGKTAIRPVELADEMAQGALPQGTQVGPSGAPLRIREGARAEIDRLVGTNINDLNTLERKIGTPQDWNSQKLGTIFGDGPRDRVAEALMNNRRFRQSYQDIVQGSQSAQRLSAAKSMDGAEGGNVPHDTTMTGVGFKALNAVAKAISGASNAKTKDEIGSVLASQGPAVQQVARALLESARATGENSRAISRVLSSPYWISAGGPGEGRKATR
jgi:hypothetical protein